MTNTFGGIYNGRSVFLTGHTGFKGSWLALWLGKLGAHVTGYARAPSTDPNHISLLDTGIESVIGDIASLEQVSAALQKAQPEIVFHLAAQPLVRLSYEDPVETYTTNLLGTLHVLESARHCSSVRAVVVITTDKVYHNNEWNWGYRENDRLGGFDPYSSSKACAEICIAGFRDSYWPIDKYGSSHRVLLASVRAGNVIGGGDWSKDRLIPDIMKATAAGLPTAIRNPRSTRPWQHVLECLSGYLMVGEKLLSGDTTCASAFNFGPADSDAIPVDTIARMIMQHWPAARFTMPEGPSGPHEAQYLKLDCSRARAMLRWEPVWQLQQALERAVTWYRDFYEQNRVNTLHDLELFCADAQAKGVPWSA
ncbi:MAG: CDP-glucose 4,6-dehydratase [Chitinivibrionales bacterium]|nr:CDP-glucose 4,6-dehydratase [Chitinivibrionales bacterium]